MNKIEKYQETLRQLAMWLEYDGLEPELRNELLVYGDRLADNPQDEEALEEIYDRFYKELEFGTAGLRGVLGAGTNRMNIYTVGKATTGLAAYINNHFAEGKPGCSGKKPCVAIAYDSRIKSDLFARLAAEILADANIDVYVYNQLMPTPALSFAVRYYGCCAGIMVTASHNPGKYNGYKAYNSEGCQLGPEAADEVYACMKAADIFSADKDRKDLKETGKKGKIEPVSHECEEAYIAAVKRAGTGVDCSNLNVVYTPLNGAGNKPVRRIMNEIGVGKVTLVKEQELPDGNFPTCSYPNPEKKEALSLGLALCRKLAEEGDAPDLLLATDPDADRVGIAVQDRDGGYTLVSGNEAGVLMLDYLCQARTLADNPIAVKTIVTTKMATAVAKHYGVEMIDVLTGFKFIGEQITMLKEKNEENRYVLGFEESYGYLSGTHVRDKDAVDASMIICEMTAYYKNQGKTLIDRLTELYEQYGYYRNEVIEFAFEGASGMEKMSRIINRFRQAPPQAITGKTVVESADYKELKRICFNADGAPGQETAITLPKSNVLEYVLEDGSTFIVRPSGTEPKLKIYLSAKGKTLALSLETIEAMKKELSGLVEKIN